MSLGDFEEFVFCFFVLILCQLVYVFGFKGFFVVGYIVWFLCDVVGMVGEFSCWYGLNFVMCMFGNLVVVLGVFDVVCEVLFDKDKSFLFYWGWEYVIGEFFCDGFMLCDFVDYCVYCCIMQMVFWVEVLCCYFDCMNFLIVEGIDVWDDCFQFYLLIKKFMFDVVVDVFFGIFFDE